MRVVGVDLGASRIGVAVSDASGTVASPHIVLRRARDRASDHAALRAVVEELEAERVVVGLPLSLSGRDTSQTSEARAFARRLADRLGGGIPVEMHDERFTTLMARRSANGGSAGEDSRAAAHLLEGWLAARER